MRNKGTKGDKLKYSHQNMLDAVAAVKEGKMGYKKACKAFGVTRSALQKRVQGKVSLESHGAGHPTVLSSETEKELVECLKIMGKWGIGLIRDELLDIVGQYVNSLRLETPFKDGRPGVDWYYNFMQRNPNLSLRKPEQLTGSRSRATKEYIDHWFTLLNDTMKDLNILNKPEAIYNVDETGLPLDPSKIRVIAEKGAKNILRIIGGSGRESITVNGCASAAGHILPPYIVYSGKNLYKEWTMGGAEGARYTTSSNGWIERDVFLDWFENHFLRHVPSTRPMLLIFDGHSSHITIQLVRKAVNNGITILRLPSHTTHFLQPLDVGVYGPVKKAWEKILISFSRKNLGRAVKRMTFLAL